MPHQIIDRAGAQLAAQLPFVLYRKPNGTSLQGFFQNDTSLTEVSDFDGRGFVFAPFNSNAPAVLLRPDVVLNVPFKDKIAEKSTPIIDKSNDISAKEAHISLVNKAIIEIKSGAFQKVVLSRVLEIEVSKLPLDIFMELVYTYKNAFCYLWYHPKIGMWLGATPEILIKSKGLEFTTMSLAGTQLATKDDSLPVWRKKELEEQGLVTEYIRNVLQDKTQQLKTEKVTSVKAGHLWHLRTKLSGRFLKNTFSTIIKSVHPTPAVCGLPLQNAKDFIGENENYKRSFYTGFLGELNFREEKNRNKNRKNQENSAYKSIVTSSELYVNLRCMQLYGAKAKIYVGGGITKDSDAEKEWEETVNKSRTLLNILSTK